MDLLGLIAVIVSCGTILGVFLLITLRPISFKIIKEDQETQIITETTEENTKNIGFVQPKEKEEYTEILDNDIAAASMDAVIQAANELMGITTIEKEKDNVTKQK